ncbi:unnamed protein product, partial [Ectocarpus sp. 4 AP-2014]
MIVGVVSSRPSDSRAEPPIASRAIQCQVLCSTKEHRRIGRVPPFSREGFSPPARWNTKMGEKKIEKRDDPLICPRCLCYRLGSTGGDSQPNNTSHIGGVVDNRPRLHPDPCRGRGCKQVLHIEG